MICFRSRFKGDSILVAWWEILFGNMRLVFHCEKVLNSDGSKVIANFCSTAKKDETHDTQYWNKTNCNLYVSIH